MDTPADFVSHLLLEGTSEWLEITTFNSNVDERSRCWKEEESVSPQAEPLNILNTS